MHIFILNAIFLYVQLPVFHSLNFELKIYSIIGNMDYLYV